MFFYFFVKIEGLKNRRGIWFLYTILSTHLLEWLVDYSYVDKWISRFLLVSYLKKYRFYIL